MAGNSWVVGDIVTMYVLYSVNLGRFASFRDLAGEEQD